MAQSPPALPKNLVSNGGFERSFRRENLWDGVDTSGYLCGERGALAVLTTSGAIADSSMPISVSVADMNNDGKPDIVAMDVLGYLRIFFNQGTAQDPKFTTGDLAGVFLSKVYAGDPILEATNREDLRRGPRVHATEMFKSGKKDLLIGNYVGEILALMNAGSIGAPDFRQPQDVGRLAIPTSKDSKKKWGNVFAPTTWDWNNDGREDLLLGEGSYSANNIHLLLNVGAGNKPTFDETNHHILAFGDGMEQLTPTVVDYNGDGKPDLLVTDRTGKIAIYINGGEQWRRGEPVPEIPFSKKYISTSSGSPISFGGISTVSTGDLNGDGLFDIVVGKSNGRITMTLNKGTKTEPKFDAPTDLKGTTGTEPMGIPSGWDVDYGINRGNFLAYVTVIKADDKNKAEPAEGMGFLRVGYSPSQNLVLPAPSTYLPGAPNFKLDKLTLESSSEGLLTNAPARMFMLRQSGRAKLKVGSSYTLSMKVRGKNNDGVFAISYLGEQKDATPEKIERGDREAVTRVGGGRAREENQEIATFSASPNWSEVKKTFKVSLKDKELKEVKDVYATITIAFSLPARGQLDIDDVKLIEQ